MAIVTKIEQQKNKSRVSIFVDGNYFCELEKETAIIFGLKLGAFVDEEKLSLAIFESEVKRAFEKGADYLASRIHSKKELITKLVKKGFSKDVAEKAVIKLADYGYVDDAMFAKSFVQVNSKYSKAVLEGRLRQKGIDKDIISEALLEVSGDAELELCIKYAKSYAKSRDVSTIEGKQKLYASLARRGFNFDTIKKACKNVTGNVEFYEDF